MKEYPYLFGHSSLCELKHTKTGVAFAGFFSGASVVERKKKFSLLEVFYFSLLDGENATSVYLTYIFRVLKLMMLLPFWVVYFSEE